MAVSDIERLIRARIPDAEVTIRDLVGDGDHYAATVIAASFRGKSRVQQHQIVYEALKAEMAANCTLWRCRPVRRIADQAALHARALPTQRSVTRNALCIASWLAHQLRQLRLNLARFLRQCRFMGGGQ